MLAQKARVCCCRPKPAEKTRPSSPPWPTGTRPSRTCCYSAFGNCGQKCSATSLLILEKEVYQDDNFKRQLVDAARSLKVGSAWGLKTSLVP
jgi:hypothetical protein